MKIVLLTNVFSLVVERIAEITNVNDFTIIDFSGSGVLSDFCKNYQIRHISFDSWEKIASELKEFDLLISYKISKIIPMDFVRKFTFGGINIHPSMLPAYRGLNPWFRLYCDMSLDSGVTIHHIDTIPDTGNIIVSRSFLIEPGQPLPVSIRLADEIAAQLISQVLTDRLYLDPGIPQRPMNRHSVPSIILEQLKKLPVIRLWHILRGFPALISTLFPELPHRFFEVSEYSLQSYNDKQTIDAYIDYEKCRIICSDGIIRLCDFSQIPMTHDYLEAVASESFVDRALENLTIEFNRDGSLAFTQGREAIVFKAASESSRVAVRFPRNITYNGIESYVQRMMLTTDYLNRFNINHFPKCKVVPQAIKLSKGVFPATVMKWCEGVTLMEYLRQNIYNEEKLVSLLFQFMNICRVNHDADIVHGDIHSGNIIIDKNDRITILDIDNLWIPMHGMNDDRGGNRNWQHPLRLHNKFITTNIDNFSEIIVCSTIYTAIVAPDIFMRNSQADFLFSVGDYTLPEYSQLLNEMISKPNTFELGNFIVGLCKIDLIKDIPAIKTVNVFKI